MQSKVVQMFDVRLLVYSHAKDTYAKEALKIVENYRFPSIPSLRKEFVLCKGGDYINSGSVTKRSNLRNVQPCETTKEANEDVHDKRK